MTLCYPTNFINEPIKRKAIKQAFIGFIASECASEKRTREGDREIEKVSVLDKYRERERTYLCTRLIAGAQK